MGVHVTTYTALPLAKDARSLLDEERVEESHQGGLDPILVTHLQLTAPEAIDDTDMDGYIDLDVEALNHLDLGGWPGSSTTQKLPLATYFSDAPPVSFSPARGHRLPTPLQQATDDHDFSAARALFSQLAHRPGTELPDLAEPLALHLAATARHSGHGLVDTVALEDSTGFSVDRTGHLRFDCVAFGRLAYSDLQDVPHLQFRFIRLGKTEQALSHVNGSPALHISSSWNSIPAFDVLDAGGAVFDVGLSPETRTEPPDDVGHLVVLISDPHGHHLLVDNTSVQYFMEPLDPLRMVSQYVARTYPGFHVLDIAEPKE